MSSIVLGALTFIQQTINAWRHPAPEKNDNALKVGVICGDTLDVSGLIDPSKTHPDILLWGIASPSPTSSTSTHAQAHTIPHTYPSSAALLSDAAIDVVYTSLPTSLHFEWGTKSLQADKHVFIGGGGPLASNAQEAEALAALAEEKGLVCMEAKAHWAFHPAVHRFREILDGDQGSKLGKVVKTDVRMTKTPAVPKDSEGWQYDMGGGSLMQMTEVLGLTRFALNAGAPDKVLFSKAYTAEHDARVDGSMHATVKFRRNTKSTSGRRNGDGSRAVRPGVGGTGSVDVYSAVYTDLARSWWRGLVPRVWEVPSVRVETEHADVCFFNAQCPHTYHHIAVTDKITGATAYEQCYKGGSVWGEIGEAWWSPQRYQLEAFVDKVRGREPVWWYDARESVVGMRAVDEVYRVSGLPVRGTGVDLVGP